MLTDRLEAELLDGGDFLGGKVLRDFCHGDLGLLHAHTEDLWESPALRFCGIG